MTSQFSKLKQDDLREHVVRGIEALRKGELYTSHGLSEDDPIIEFGVNPPARNEKSHPFNMLLDFIATDMARLFGAEKRQKKAILRQLQVFGSTWADLLSTREPVESNDAAPMDTDTKSNGVQSTLEETEEEIVAEDAQQEESEPRPRSAESLQRMEQRKAEFERTRDQILQEVPKSVKDRFGKIYFTKWSNQMLVCLVLSPYSVPPGGVRDMWFEMFEKLKKTKRLVNLTNLCYWYGSYNDPLNAYSFIPTKSLTSYSKGVEKGYDKLPDALRKKVDAGKSLTTSQKQLVVGLEEMLEDLDKPPSERSGKMSHDFDEDYELPSDEEGDPDGKGLLLDDVEIEEEKKSAKKLKKAKSKPSTKPRKKLAKKRKKSTEGEEDEPLESPVLKKKVKGSKKTATVAEERKEDVAPMVEDEKVEEKPEGEPSLPDPQTVEAKPAPANDTDDTGAPSHDEEDEDYKFAMGDVASDEDRDDEDFFNATGAAVGTKNVKKKKVGEPVKEPPKKKVTKVKHKRERKTEKVSKVPTEEERRQQEQRKFRQCEKKYLLFVKRWKLAIDEKSVEELRAIYKELLGFVDEFTCPFIEAYDISPMMKRSKLIVDTPDRKNLIVALREHYKANKGSVPAGFKPKKMKQMKQEEPEPEPKNPPPEAKEEPSAVKSEPTEPDNPPVKVEDSPAPIVSAPIKRVGSLEKVGLTEPDTVNKSRDTPVKADRKKRFSLGNLMRPTSNTTKTEAKNIAEKIISTSQTTQKQERPKWISAATDVDAPTESNRSFALEFLQQASPFIPHDSFINHDAIARSLEKAVYEWARQRNAGDWAEHYWEKVHDIVASISGKESSGTIAALIAEGKFKTPEEVVLLSDDALLESFEGRPLSL